jgi:hypothetical protein
MTPRGAGKSLTGPAILVLEFKVGERQFSLHALDQVVDYALDLKNFHEPSHKCTIAPILIATGATVCHPIAAVPHSDGRFSPTSTNGQVLRSAIETVLRSVTVPPQTAPSGSPGDITQRR